MSKKNSAEGRGLGGLPWDELAAALAEAYPTLTETQVADIVLQNLNCNPTANNLPGRRVPASMSRRIVDVVYELAEDSLAADPNSSDADYTKVALHLVRNATPRFVEGIPGARPLHNPLLGRCEELSEALAEADPTLTLTVGWVIYPHPSGTGEHYVIAHAWTETPDGRVVDPVWGDAGPLCYLGCPIAEERQVIGLDEPEALPSA